MAKQFQTLREQFPQPPIFHLLAPAERLVGDHTNLAWRGQVGASDGASRAVPMIVKRVPSQIQICIELACALAAQALLLPIPAPGLVIAERQDLPGLPETEGGNEVLLVGSMYKNPDALFAKVVEGDPAADELVWNRLCSSPAGAQGAAWDELVVNADRHSQNALFDGAQWWLFDHDLALPKASDFIRLEQQERTAVLDFTARCNLLAEQMLSRRPSDHGMHLQPDEFARRRRSLTVMVDLSTGWTHENNTIASLLQITAHLLSMINLRLPSLGLHLQRRLNQPNANDLWTSHSPA